MSKRLKIGIDYHGVITQNPAFFGELTSLALKENHQIVVLSGAKAQDVEAYLLQNNISYSAVFSLLDYFQARELATFYEDGSFFVPSVLWDRAKADYCLKNGVDLHIDDSMLYGTYFQTPFCLYSKKGERCTFIKKNVVLDFQKSAKEVLSDIVSALGQF